MIGAWPYAIGWGAIEAGWGAFTSPMVLMTSALWSAAMRPGLPKSTDLVALSRDYPGKLVFETEWPRP
jgi:hypothetical protein